MTEIDPKLIAQINELAKKSKTVGLDDQEKALQDKLRKKYLKMFREGFKNQIEMVRVFNNDGQEVTPAKVQEIQRKKKLR